MTPSVPRSVWLALDLPLQRRLTGRGGWALASGPGPAVDLLCVLYRQDREVWWVAWMGLIPVRPSWAISPWQELLS